MSEKMFTSRGSGKDVRPARRSMRHRAVGAMQSVTAETQNLQRIAMKRLYHAIPAQRKGPLRLDEPDLGINAGI